MSEENASTESAPETATATAPEPPTDFREFVKWRETGELPEKVETPPVVAETPAKSEPQSGAEEIPAAADEEVETDRTGRGSSRIRRIDRLTRENEMLKQQLASMAGQSASQPQPAAPEQPKPSEPQGRPKLHDYPTLEAYQEALTDWKLDQREAQRKAEAAQAEAQAAEKKLQAEWSKNQDTARAAHADYDEVLQSIAAPEGPGIPAARQAMLEDENGAEILYYLATHPEELQRIAAMQPIAAIRQIGRLSAILVPPSAAAGNPKPKVSGAPKPPAPLSRPSAGASRKDILDEDFARTDYRAWSKVREAQLKGK